MDNTPSDLLKDTACSIAAPFAHLINLSLQTGIFPTDMKIAKLVTVHKSGSLLNFHNYRPISVLPPVLSQVIELMEFLEKNKLLLSNMESKTGNCLGLRTMSSTVQQLYVMENIRQRQRTN